MARLLPGRVAAEQRARSRPLRPNAEMAFLIERHDAAQKHVNYLKREHSILESGIVRIPSKEAVETSLQVIREAQQDVETIRRLITRFEPAQPQTLLVSDAEGWGDLKPDPLDAHTPQELVAALRRYREWAGAPSFRQMAARAGQKVAHTTMHTALKSSDRLPKFDVLMAIVVGCGGDENDQRAFATSWRRIRVSRSGS